MDRRELLKRLLVAGGGTLLGGTLLGNASLRGGFSNFIAGVPADLNSGRPIRCGWVDNPAWRKNYIKTTRHPFLSSQNDAIKNTGAGKTVLLYKFFEEVTGRPLETHVQATGDCVAHAYGLGVDILTAVRIIMHGRPEQWVAKAATEIIYAGGRVEVGRGSLRGAGCMGLWAGTFLRDWGALLRQPYLAGKYNFTDYSGRKADLLGGRGRGVPDDLEPLCREHPVKTCAIVRSWEECRDSIANGYPVAMSSNIGFNTTRDSEGFLKRRDSWAHSMAVIAIDDNPRRPGALVQNSWHKRWVSGPTKLGQPVGSFWADASAIDAAVRQGDSMALSGYTGYPRVEIPDYIIW